MRPYFALAPQRGLPKARAVVDPADLAEAYAGIVASQRHFSPGGQMSPDDLVCVRRQVSRQFNVPVEDVEKALLKPRSKE